MKTALICTLSIASLITVRAADWPQWGGNDPGRNMYSEVKGLPDSFEPGKFKPNSEDVDLATTKNVKWVAKLGSQTYGNPVVANGKLFVGTNNATPRDERMTDDRSCLFALNEYNGEFLWQLAVPKLASGKVNDWEYLGLLSSPLVEGNKLYVVTNRCEVVCLDVDGMANGNDGSFKDEAKYLGGPGKPPIEPKEKDGDILWRYDMMDELGVFPHNASNSSPIAVGDSIFVCTSNGQDWTHVNIPSPLSPSFISLDKKTGALLGEDDAGIGPRIFHGQWTSPSVGAVNGKQQVYFGGGDGVLYALSATPTKEGDTDYIKKVWWFDCVPDEYKKDATKTGDVTKSALIWDFKEIHRSISTVSIDPNTGLLFIGDFSGFIFCLDAETGKKYWEHDMKAHMWGSTFVADGKVYVGDEDGDFVIMAATKDKKILTEVNMGAPIYSTPVVANGTMYIGTQTHLYAIALGAKPVQTAAAK